MRLFADPDRLPDAPLGTGPRSQFFTAMGITTLRGAADWVMRLPYGRVSDPGDVGRDQRGTCSTKHAYLASLAEELGLSVGLTLGMYEMSGANTPGVGEALAAAGLPSVLEAHVYLKVGDHRIDLTRPVMGEIVIPVVAESPLRVADLPDKATRHRAALQRWCADRGLDPDATWRAREAAIRDLGRRHSLVVGGTGMLRGVSVDLASRGDRVTVLARPGPRLSGLSDGAGAAELIRPLGMDWHDPRAVVDALDATIADRGPVGLAILWIHGSAADTRDAVAQWLVAQGVPRWIEVRGSAAGSPDADPSPWQGAAGWQEVVLGFVAGPRGSRWLTHAEIVAGVLASAESGETRTVVGTVTPWSDRP